jgi:predicted RNA-binding Zn-ribbon protein involved in translation (DUF1610 family)
MMSETQPFSEDWLDQLDVRAVPEDDYWFVCPYCLEQISVRVDVTGGQSQSFAYDCDVCCQPIAIDLSLDGEGVVGFQAERES